ncbi:hypothetical protein E2C01_047222 [Portunus trituberculatus]|uniref:Uncharacterized protein n=1 Tax=Portunus trituberculatus TaxID=210409 RepID=A0A5B7G7Z0_PORTR|nr:hypothetical protein [Portunus trituberculatus]
MLKWRVRGDMDDTNPSLKTMVTPECPPCSSVTPSTASVTQSHASDSLSALPPPPAPPNKSFLHQSFVTGSSPSLQYYDGRGSRPSLPPTPFHGPLSPPSGPRYYESQGRYSLPPPTYEEPLDPAAEDPRCYNGRYSLPLPTYEEPSRPSGEDSGPSYYDCKGRISPPLPMYEVPRSPLRVEESVYEACPGNEDAEERPQGGGGGAYDAPPSHYACPGNNAAVTPHRARDEHVQGASRTACDAVHISTTTTTTTTTTTSTGTNTTEQDEWRRASRSNSGSYGTGKRRPRPRYYFGTMPSIRPNCSSNSFTHYSTPRGNRPVLPRPPLPAQFLSESHDDAADPLQHYDFPKKRVAACDSPTQGDEYEDLSPYIVSREQRSAAAKDQKTQGVRGNVLRRLRAFMLRDEAGKDRKPPKEPRKCKRTISLRKQTKEDKHKAKDKTEAQEEYQSLDLPRDNLKEALDLSVGRGCRRKEDGRPRGERWRGLFHTVREKLSPPQRPSVFWVVLTAQESGKENGETEALTEEGVSGAGGGGGDPAGGGGEGSPQKSPPPSPQPPQTQTIYHTFPRRRSRPPRLPLRTSPLTSTAIPDGAYVHLFPFMVSWQPPPLYTRVSTYVCLRFL